MKRLTAGILAHVDAGKTTLSEGLLYTAGNIRKLGRVDKQDSFLDENPQERARGITIFSKQALLTTPCMEITLLDTPGHVDFSSEMERTLQVLDVAILVISGSDGVQGHTLTLWRLLDRYKIPVFLFINKMDQPGTEQNALMNSLKARLSDGCVDFSETETNHFYENVALCDEKALEEYLEKGAISTPHCQKLIDQRKLFPCLFGSALKLDGIAELIHVLEKYTINRHYGERFGARIFKITRDEAGNRLTHMKITGDRLRVRELLEGTGVSIGGKEEKWQEKINQIRIYSGEKYDIVNEAQAGQICAVTGLTQTRAGEGLGEEKQELLPFLEPVLSYAINLPEGCDAAVMLPKLRQLEEEEPQLHIVWDEKNKELKAQIMGQVQMEILQDLIENRFHVKVTFDSGTILYKETIKGNAIGVGHFEPLRHYAEVVLLLEEGEPGSGIQIASDCSEDVLDRNWQRLILTHLAEKEHVGVLTGSPVTDMKITLKAGRAHTKHTEGGDFRQATYRALRQGLMGAESILLEPYFDFRLEIPDFAVGRAMTDLDKMQGSFVLTQPAGEMAVLTGSVPMAQFQNYPREVAAYTKGAGQLTCSLKGYFPCGNAEEVISASGYDPMKDLENTPDSVFCAHGAGFIVSWNQVPSYMHTESIRKESMENEIKITNDIHTNSSKDGGRSMGLDEIEEILSRASMANKKENRNASRTGWQHTHSRESRMTMPEAGEKKRTAGTEQKKEEYLLIDGYNVIFAWDELNELAKVNLDSARGKLLDILCNYQAIKQMNLIVVFDAYRVSGHQEESLNYHNIHVVYTAEAETADCYIEKFAHNNSNRYQVTVATSDGLEQIIIIGEGCRLISSRELETEIEQVSARLMEEYRETNRMERLSLKQQLSGETIRKMEELVSPAPPEDINEC